MPKDYYRILDLPRQCSAEQIKKAYKQALKAGPGNMDAGKWFDEIYEAYRVLINQVKLHLPDLTVINRVSIQKCEGDKARKVWGILAIITGVFTLSIYLGALFIGMGCYLLLWSEYEVICNGYYAKGRKGQMKRIVREINKVTP